MLGLPEAASAHAADIDGFIGIVHWFMLLLFVGWGALFIYCLVRFRASRNPRADYYGLQSKGPKYIEAGVVIFEVFLLFAFAFPLWGQWVQDFPQGKDTVQMRIVAEQFAWNFHYPGPDGLFGKSKIDMIDLETNPLGLDRNGDPAAADDVVTVNQMYIPINKPVTAQIASKDVIHSFKVVAMRVTQDATPGIEVPVSFTPIKEGKYEIQCAQLCGIGHYRMRGFVNVLSQDKYDSWMEEQQIELAESEDEDDFW